MIDHAAGYAVFASGGYRIEPYGIEEIRSTSGRVLYDRARSVEPPERIFPADKIAEINSMLHNAVESGTGQRAKLPGIPAGGKTGTTQSSRDAWFCGFTGNMVGVVWVGNDDYTPMERVTGGMLPAPIWHEVMDYAHQNIELKQAPGMPVPRRGGGPAIATLGGKATGGLTVLPPAPQAERPKSLSAKSIGVLTEIEKRLDAVSRAAPGAPARSGSLQPLGPAPSELVRLAEGGPRGGLRPIGRE